MCPIFVMLLLVELSWNVVNCLRISTTNIETKVCRDLSEQQSDIGILVREVRTFFEHQKIVIYPAVLSMVAAMRYGSVAPIMANKPFLVDHDLDFMLVLTEQQSLMEVTDLSWNFTSHLQSTTGLSSSLTNFSNLGNSATGWFRHYLATDNVALSVMRNYYWTNVEVQKHTKLTDKFNKDGIVSEGRYVSKRFFEFVGSNESDMSIFAVNSSGRGFQVDQTNINFWFPTVHSAAYEGSSTLRTLFMGEVFAFPQDANVILHNLLDEFGSFHRASKSTMCDFSYPHGLYEEDMEESNTAFQLARKCTKQLQQEGFGSFADCDVKKL